MKKEKNTGLGLIKTTIERVQNEKSLFCSALKKLVNSTEEELYCFLKGRTDNRIVINGIAYHLQEDIDILVIDALDCLSEDCDFYQEKMVGAFVDPCFEELSLGWERPKTRKILAGAKKIVVHSSFKQVFIDINNDLDKVVMEFPQIVRFCRDYKNWPCGSAMFFLRKVRDKYFVMRIDKSAINSKYFEFDIRQLELADVWSDTSADFVVFPCLILPEK